MSYNCQTLRSFVNAEGKLVLCNEPFFAHFGHCTQHLIGRFITDVFSACDCSKILAAVQCCQSNPGQSVTVETVRTTAVGGDCFRWEIYAEQASGRITGIHLIGQSVHQGKAA